jgi:hypothetical protein
MTMRKGVRPVRIAIFLLGAAFGIGIMSLIELCYLIAVRGMPLSFNIATRIFVHSLIVAYSLFGLEKGGLL